MDPEPEQISTFLNIINVIVKDGWYLNSAFLLSTTITIIILLLLSAAFSASENAFFSIGPNELVELNGTNASWAKTTLKLLNEPDRQNAARNLLATILLLNNFVNITIVILSSLALNEMIDLKDHPIFAILVEVIGITFMLVLFGEIIPKIYATQNNLKIAKALSIPIYWIKKIFSPLVWVLTRTTTPFDRYIESRTHRVSVEDLNHAIDIAGVQNDPDEKNILKGLVNYGNISVKQIMKSRLDVVAVETDAAFNTLLKNVEEWGYSRVPVYENSFDNIKGILYIKDLVPHLNHPDNFGWQQLIRPPFFVPEFKKIDDLLKEFQEKRIHLAVVVDEYGGTSGIVTMEDVLEEIFGEIKDEFDDEEPSYSKLDEDTFVFEGKISLNDMCKIFGVDSDWFDEIKGETDTLAGLILELAERIPPRGHAVSYGNFTFTVETADKRMIKRAKVFYNREQNEDGNVD